MRLSFRRVSNARVNAFLAASGSLVAPKPRFRAWAFHCFGCEAQGDIFEWVMRRQSMSFPRALRAGGGQCRGHAWMVANHEDREARWRGVPVPVKRGQRAHSTTGLAERWHWSRPKVRAFLDELREMCKITFKMDNVATVITVLDYEMFNPAEEQADLIAEQPHTDTKSNTEVELEVGTGKGNLEMEVGIGKEGTGKGEGPPPPKNALGIMVAIEWCRKNQTGHSDDEVKAAWNGLMAAAVDGLWMTGRRPVADWRRALADECWKRRQITAKKFELKASVDLTEWICWDGLPLTGGPGPGVAGCRCGRGALPAPVSKKAAEPFKAEEFCAPDPASQPFVHLTQQRGLAAAPLTDYIVGQTMGGRQWAVKPDELKGTNGGLCGAGWPRASF